MNAMMNEKKLTIRNENLSALSTKNTTMMDKAVRHVKMKGLSKDIID